MWQSETARSPLRRKISEMLEARMTGQISQLLSYFSPEAVVHCACSRGSLLGPGVWKGADALQSITRLTDENFQPLEYEILETFWSMARKQSFVGAEPAPPCNRHCLLD